MNIPYVMKKCSKCGKWLVASTVNFHRFKHGAISYFYLFLLGGVELQIEIKNK